MATVLSDALKVFLEKNNLTQGELAKKLSVSPPAISNVMRGVSKMAEENMVKILNNKEWNSEMLVDVYRALYPKIQNNTKVNVRMGATPSPSCSREDKILITSLKEKVSLLQKQLKDEKDKSKQYWDMIVLLQKQLNEIGKPK